MNCMQKALGTVFVAFSALTAYALHAHGLCDTLHQAVATPANVMFSTDLVIALSLVSAWLWRDARTRGVNPWPFLLLTATLGSVGPLLYLICKAGVCSDGTCGLGKSL